MTKAEGGLVLMRTALELLDDAGHTLAAACLQHAMDTVAGMAPLREDEKIDSATASAIERFSIG